MVLELDAADVDETNLKAVENYVGDAATVAGMVLDLYHTHTKSEFSITSSI